MTFDKYEIFEDPYSYRGLNCLKNRLGLRDAALLQAFEVEMSTLRAEEPLPDGRFGPAHYRRIHWHLFRDVYRWAERYRTVRTGKGGNWFCFPEHIDSQMKRLFGRLADHPFVLGSEASRFISATAEFLAELNAIHHFREGNGRAQLTFIHLVAIRAGHPLRLELIRPESFMPAMVESFHGRLAALTAEMSALLE